MECTKTDNNPTVIVYPCETMLNFLALLVSVAHSHWATFSFPAVPLDQNGFPDFSQWTDYETRLSVDQYLLGDKAQFKLLNRRLARDMENNEALRNRINDGLMEVLREGIGEKNGNGRIKLKKFLDNNPTIRQRLSDEEYRQLVSGQRSPTLAQRMENDPELRRLFFEANYQWIKKGEDPVGYTWHHHQDEGRMQLVRSRVHQPVKHTGGRQIWGGGR